MPSLFPQPIPLGLALDLARADPFPAFECRGAADLQMLIAVLLAQCSADSLRDPLLAQVRKVLIPSEPGIVVVKPLPTVSVGIAVSIK